MPSKTEEKQMQIYLPLEQSLLHGPVQSVCSRTEKAATTESGVCRVFDRAPVAESNRKWLSENKSLTSCFLLFKMSAQLQLKT